jgi:tRNA-binding EMAP/Myf-like protein
MNNAAIVCRIKNVRPHPNADRVQLGTACGYQVVVGLDIHENDLGIYFPTDTCLGKDFAEANPELLTYFGKNLRVRTQKFRGENSEGFWCHLQHLPLEVIEAGTKEGTELTTVNGKEVCKKYINPATLNKRNFAQNIAKRLRSGSLPTFQKHVETEHLRKEWERIPKDRQWIWTVKVHGTSQRVGNVLVERDLSLVERFLQWAGIPVATNRYEYLVGSRNVILGELKPDGSVGKDNFYSDEFRKEAAKPFLGNLHKGEVVYYEVVGYAAYNSPVMGTVTPKDKELKKLYGDEITYSYGCANGSFDIYVYRIAYQNEDGTSIDLTWDQVKKRCTELGVKYVPEHPVYGYSELDIKACELDKVVEILDIERPDPVDDRHPMEGVVLRVEGSKPEFYKEKSFTFKVLEGIIKDADVVDLEEAS